MERSLPTWDAVQAGITGIPLDRCRRIAVAAASRALEVWPDHPSVFDEALVVAGSGPVPPDMRDAVVRTADALDQRYLELHDDADPAGRSPGWVAAFREARAAAAVVSALDPDASRAAAGAIYEGCYASDADLTSLLRDFP